MTADKTIKNNYKIINHEYDVVIGSRYVKGAKINKKQNWQRRVVSRLGNKYIQAVLLPGIMDTQCGFKLFSTEVAKKVFADLQVKGWGFDLEVLAKVQKAGYKTKEVPMVWHDVPRGRVNMVTDGWKVFWDVVRIKARIDK